MPEGCTRCCGTHGIILFVIATMDKKGFTFHFATSWIFVEEKELYDGNHMVLRIKTNFPNVMVFIVRMDKIGAG